MNLNWKGKISSYYQKLTGKGNSAILARGAASSFALKIGGTGLTFLVQVLGARLLGVEGYGIYALAFSWMTMLALLGQMGFDTASLRYIAQYNSQAKWGLLRGFLRYSSWFVAIASGLTAIALATGAWWLRHKLGLETFSCFAVASVLLPVTTFLKLQEQRLIAWQRIFTAQFPVAILRNLLILAALVILLWASKTVNAASFMVVILIASAIALLYLTWGWHQAVAAKIARVKPSFASREWLQTGWGMILVSSLQIVLVQSDTIMIGALVGATEAGLYTAAKRIAGLLIFPLIAVNASLSATIVSLYAQQARAELQRVVNLAVNAVFLITLATCVAIAVAGKPILAIFGGEFSAGYTVLLILLLGQLINSFSGPVAVILNMTGHHHDTARWYLVSAVTNIGLNFALIPVYGAEGAAIATVIATIISNLAMAIAVWQRIGIIAIAFPKFYLKKLTR